MLDAYATALFNKDSQYIREFCKRREVGVIAVEKDSGMILDNLRDLKISSIELLYT